MKKLMFLAVMMLLGSGLTKAFVWQGVREYEQFTFWNIDAPQDYNTVHLMRGQSHAMYFYFTTPHDISELTMEIRFYVMGYTFPGDSFLKYLSVPYRTPFPAQEQHPVEVMANIEVSNIAPPLSGYMEITFENENGMPLAGGKVEVVFE